MTPTWVLLAGLVLAQIAYPLVPGPGPARAGLVIATVLLGWLLSVTHAARSRGWRAAGALVLVTTGGGLVVEVVGVATGFPFGGYGYGGALGPKLAGVPLIIPLAWTWMAWPAWLVAGRLIGRTTRPPATGHPTSPTSPTSPTTGHPAGPTTNHPTANHPTSPTTNHPAGPNTNHPAGPTTYHPVDPVDPVAPAARIVLAGWGLAAWDLFLDPQMVGQGYWRWARPRPALPGIPGVPVTNFLGWLAVAVLMMAALALTLALTTRCAPAARRPRSDAPMIVLYLWTYASSVLAGVAFLHLSGPAAWIGAVMGVLALPLAMDLIHRRERVPAGPRRPVADVPGPERGRPVPAGRPAGGAG